MLATFIYAQDSQFFFDPNGNLFVQTAENNSPPQILGQPQNRIVAPGETAAFSVVAENTSALTFQWQFNSTNIGRATKDSLLLQNVSTNNEGEYRVVLTNPSGGVTSAPALLMMDSDADGMPDSWERTYFANLSQNATADFDGDGISNADEFADNTNPTNSVSALFRLTLLSDGGSVIKTPDQSSYTNGSSVTLTASPAETFHAWTGEVLTRTNSITLVMTNNKTVFAHFGPITFLWTNAISGDWETATNWSPNLAPGSNDTVIIRSSVTVTLNTSADCADVTLGDGSTPTLTGSGTLTVRGDFLWTDGTMSGSGRTIVEPGATLNAAIPSIVLLTTRTLENGGTVLWSGGTIGMNSGAVITNRPGALFEARSVASINSFAGVNRFDNAGTFRKTANSGTATIASGVSFNNSGTVEIQTGTLLCNANFNNVGAVNLSSATTHRLAGGGSATGTFDTPATALVEWTGGTFTLNPGAQLNGAGLYKINGPAATVTGNTNLVVKNLDLIDGTLDGTGTVTVNGAMNWTGGTMSGGGRTIIPAGVTLNLAPPSSVTLSTRTLENGGTVLWTGAGNIILLNGVITNRAGALINAQNAAALFFAGGACRFDNTGTFRKSINTGPTTAGVNLNNFGTVEIQTGTLLCSGSFNNNGAVSLSPGTTNRYSGGGSCAGLFNAPSNSLLEWSAGTFTLNPGSQLNGAGLYRINGGNLVANEDMMVVNLDLLHTSSDLTGTGVVTISGAMNWTAGMMSGSGRTIIGSGATLRIANADILILVRRLENAGSAFWSGSQPIGLLNGIITNRSGGLFDVQNASRLFFGGGACRFDNDGMFRKSLTNGTLTIAAGISFNNSGTVDIRSGILAANGGYNSTSNAVLNCALGGTTAGTGYGQLQVAGAVMLNGALSVDLINGFLPTTNDSFTVVTAGTRNGTFADFFYPSNVVTMQLSNTANSVIVSISGIPILEPVLFPPVLSSSNILLSWTAVSNKTYRLEFNPDLAPTNWDAVPGDVTALSNRAIKLDALTSSNRFYRVRVLP